MLPIQIPLPVPILRMGIHPTLRIDRIRYSISRKYFKVLRPHLGRQVDVTRGKHSAHQLAHPSVTIHYILLRRFPVRVTFAKNPFRCIIDVDDPTPMLQLRFLSLFKRLGIDFALSQVEVALDLVPTDASSVSDLLRVVLGHVAQPRARLGHCKPYANGQGNYPTTWYFNDPRWSTRGLRVYPSRKSNPIRFVRVEAQINRRFATFGIDPADVIDLHKVKFGKLLAWRKFDSAAALRLAMNRLPPALKPQNAMGWEIAKQQFRSMIRCALRPAGSSSLNVLGQQMDNYRRASWAAPQDMPKVFPRLPCLLMPVAVGSHHEVAGARVSARTS